MTRPPIGAPDTEEDKAPHRPSQPTPTWLDSLMKE
jgi:hypothetical protein